ncbi:MAG: hypothetical protein RMK45_10665 [Armatimonadota bacterium]|nr:hypothetical protein [Armatimonadota bacterium]
MRNYLRLITCGFVLVLSTPVFAQVVHHVSVSQEQGQTLITVSGTQLPRPRVSVWRRQFLVLEFNARYSGRNAERKLATPHALKLRYGWFTSRPPKTRVVITLRGKPPYALEQTPDGWRVRLGKALSTNPPTEPAPTDVQAKSAPQAPPLQTKQGDSPKPVMVSSVETVPPRVSEPPSPRPTTPPPPPTRVLVSLDFVNAEISDVLKALAIQSGANILTAPDVKGTITVSLSRLTVEEALSLITRLSGYRYEKFANTYVVGTEASLKAFREASEPPKPPEPPKPRTVEALTFKVAKPTDIATYLNARFPELKVTPAGDKDATYLLIEGDADTVARAREAAYAFEQQLTGSVEIVTEVYRVKYADSRDLARIVRQLVPTVQVSLGPDALLSRAGAGGSSGGGSGMPQGGDAPSPAAQQMGAPMPAGNNQGDSQTAQPPNLLVLMGTAREVLRALEILRKVDIKQPQVLIEARVMDVSEASLKALGISFEFLQSGAVNNLDRSEATRPLPRTGTTYPNQQSVGFNRDGKLGLDFNFLKAPVEFSAKLEALADDRRNRLLANPRVATLDGRPATIFIGDEVNFVKLIQQTPQGANVQTDSVQAGIILNVLPRVHEDNSITLQIKPEVSVITGFLKVPGGGELPQLARRNAETTIRVGNGETVIIGGLIREADIRNIQKVPILGDLPFLGYLFRRTSTTREKSEIVIMLTVRVLE